MDVKLRKKEKIYPEKSNLGGELENHECLEKVELDLTFVEDDGKVCVGQSVTDTLRNWHRVVGDKRWVENAWAGEASQGGSGGRNQRVVTRDKLPYGGRSVLPRTTAI